MTHDSNGRAYAKLSEMKPGVLIKTDGGFPCMRKGAIHTVQCDDGGLYVACGEGQHYLEGQVDDADGDTLIGLYPAAASPAASAHSQEERGA